ncbi:hypothetical protein EV215_0329 [Hypnocyclicus thermotrophus]|uniref:Uncharacterized protein n=1 Tax=Hypnocyclicus thermotrophus TaxID=1627895 RepID=A0AA46I6G3_9FUSO|nr:hypothetical protein [Hypnocyclicus thermotrophus]TDT72519.1 hypothetical protein EV215_0329 [Hypnocyclicus thermotrophus]
MKISGFTTIKNVSKLYYPVKESMMNNYSRKMFGFKSSNEVYEEKLVKLA